METIFTKIVNRQIPAHIVYEDDLVIAFLDITQATKGHTLVVSKAPYKDIFEIPRDLFKHLFGVVHKLSGAINKSFNPLGINLLNNNGIEAGQTVFHYHVHIIPRYDLNEIDIKLKNNSSNLNVEDYKKRAEMIITALL
ncbi:HIT family protein [Acholeplasma granularum]|uniref:HIT family protein n=1 Tax=Acholeplasma granularum TaxID=264635 RepID=UPI000472FB17|nr:HIT family protein [Acholeplasma granularum]